MSRLQSSLLMVLSVTFLTATDAAAVASFGATAPIAPHASSDDPTPGANFETHPVATGDGQGNWVAIWYRISPFDAPTVNDIVVTRSSNDGQDWSESSVLATTSEGDSYADLATNRVGVWIAVWHSHSDNAVVVSRSTDNGQTWSSPISPLGALTTRCRIATDEVGTWVIVAERNSGGPVLVRSTDDGMTWSPPVALDMALAGDPAVSTDGTGNWVAAWQRNGASIVIARSTDNAASWQSPLVLGDSGLGGASGRSSIAITTDRESRWVTIWETASTATGEELRYSVSVDNGATWSSQALFPPAAARAAESDIEVWTQASVDGDLYAVWSSLRGSDRDLFMSRSSDGGSSWSSATLVNLSGRTDRTAFDFQGSLGYDGARTWVSTWISDNSLGGVIGEDLDILHARGTDDCPSSPMTGCKLPTEPGRSRIRIKDDPDGSMDQLSWTWKRGQETLFAELGDPIFSSDYVMCLYDDTGAGFRSVFEADAASRRLCGDFLYCWIQEGSGFIYRDRESRHGAIADLKIFAGEEGRAKIKLKASGNGLGLPAMPFAKSPSVRAQLINLETSACWEATYSNATVETSTQFKAKSD